MIKILRGAPPGGLGSNTGGGGLVIVELPLNKIRRPLMRTRSNDATKVQQLMDSISDIGLQVLRAKKESNEEPSQV
ncbi:hypothetical protein PIB30_093550 [Stylosanthes scabra]|uniref:Uncharacterized protein n=1 Tax=Stylosanthes scabra TaxID=79078 RepID=A0ABU6XUZ4_9FABA|nr:hypothetical protein [Stylosanthes scabra]